MESRKPLPAVPTTATEMVALWGRYVARQIKDLNRRPSNGPDILQSVWLRLFESDVVGKYHAKIVGAGSTPTPESFGTYLRTAVHNAFANWCRTQSRRATKEFVVDHLVRFPRGTDGSFEAESLFDFVTDVGRPERVMEAGIDVRRTVEKMRLRGKEEDFLYLISDGYTVAEALGLIAKAKAKIRRIERALTA